MKRIKQRFVICWFFSAGVRDSQGIDGMYPETEEQFEQFGEALKSKITFFEVLIFFSVTHLLMVSQLCLMCGST